MGMWIFLSSEILIFGVLIFLFQLAFNANELAFKEASRELHFYHGTFNTVILLTSSYFVALSEATKKRFWLILAMILGTVFLVVKGFEYYDLTMEGKFPLHFANLAKDKMLFFTFYGFTTFLHLVHVLIGIILLGMAWFLFHSEKEKGFHENVGLYWHFVDLVWVFIYPLYYLLGH